MYSERGSSCIEASVPDEADEVEEVEEVEAADDNGTEDRVVEEDNEAADNEDNEAEDIELEDEEDNEAEAGNGREKDVVSMSGSHSSPTLNIQSA